ncbi:MAG: hypothetical protein RQ982_10720 [Gammaproteobacteria bacterium]|nr:hypothetical protein [Gammaproteobacteria bacterium]
MKPFGLSYVLSYILKYPAKHAIGNFSGNLLDIKSEYRNSDEPGKSEITRRFVKIVDALVLQNGVRKTTYSSRQNAAMSSLCSGKHKYIDKTPITVLDLPSSVGLSSIDLYKILSEHYEISKYMLADQFFNILYDEDRGCIFDESGNLLQVKFKRYFFSIHRPHTSGSSFGIIASLLLSPFSLTSYLLRKRYPFKGNAGMARLLLMHPEAEQMVDQGIFDYKKTDVFSKINGAYDLILSFNLLQKNYFSDDLIATGTDNLKNALNENGLLVMGNTESYTISRKQGDNLITLEAVGSF